MIDEAVEARFLTAEMVTCTSIVAARGSRELALYGSFLPVSLPATRTGGAPTPVESPAGAIAAADGHLQLNEGRESVRIPVTNRGDRPIQVGSHYHFIETNRALVFDRGAAYGRRLDIPAASGGFEPGETKAAIPCRLRAAVSAAQPLADGPVPAQAAHARCRRFATGVRKLTAGRICPGIDDGILISTARQQAIAYA